MNADGLGFRIEYDPRHGVWVKVRDDGRRGPCVGDEAALWRALQAAQAALAAEQKGRKK